jgi:hypothetical protein
LENLGWGKKNLLVILSIRYNDIVERNRGPMKQLGKINTEKIERIIELMKEFDNLDREVRRELEALLPEGVRFGYIEDSFEPYYKPLSREYIFEHYIAPTSKEFFKEYKDRHLVVRKDGTALLMTSEELWGE